VVSEDAMQRLKVDLTVRPRDNSENFEESTQQPPRAIFKDEIQERGL
jgi:hypothetical protein